MANSRNVQHRAWINASKEYCCRCSQDGRQYALSTMPSGSKIIGTWLLLKQIQPPCHQRKRDRPMKRKRGVGVCVC
ncbi:uncharacterized protein LOC118746291 isoform X2 [Rhagoletis pomonella]|uniref:uncharacterized protein LOC118746291 isoform X2 n=1 Tax=Rhagoletis pomonella TaxID=28610 RepID=UPI0017800ADF|nr:uncharacterized protein LOC118746291 isoform X2 [Rhagoletis pomonella]